MLLASLVAAVVSFVAISRLYDSFSAKTELARPKASLELELKTGVLTPVQGAALGEDASGIVLASRFQPGVTGPILGAAYINFSGERALPKPGKKLVLEIDATKLDPNEDGQKMEAVYVQNGLQTGPWVRMLLAAGRTRYYSIFDTPTDKRGSDKIDTLWIRSDTTGKGLKVILHRLRLSVQ